MKIHLGLNLKIWTLWSLSEVGPNPYPPLDVWAHVTSRSRNGPGPKKLIYMIQMHHGPNSSPQLAYILPKCNTLPGLKLDFLMVPTPPSPSTMTMLDMRSGRSLGIRLVESFTIAFQSLSGATSDKISLLTEPATMLLLLFQVFPQGNETNVLFKSNDVANEGDVNW